MELLLAAVVTILTQWLKKFTDKYGKEWALVWAFVLTFLIYWLYTYIYTTFTWFNWKSLEFIFAGAIALYELILKRIWPTK